MHKYFKYNPDTNNLEATRTIVVEAATINVANQSESSNGDDLIITNLTTGIVYHMPKGGLKPQALLENQGDDGIVPLIFPHFTSDLIPSESNAPALNEGAVDYIVNNTIPIDASIFAQTVMVAQDINPTDWLRYTVMYEGFDEPVYLQSLSGIEASDGDILEWNFTHGVKAHAGQVVEAEMTISLGSQDGQRSRLQVRPGQDGVSRWGIGHIRAFSDQDIMSGIISILNSGSIKYASTYAVKTSLSEVTLTVNESIGYKSFIVFDSDGTFHQNSCFVIIGGDSYEMDKKDKQYSFWKEGAIWRWSEANREAN